MAVISDAALQDRLRGVLQSGWLAIPGKHGGTGAPGLFLEELLEVRGGNSDTPDAGRWEIKYHSKQTSLLTLFHKEAMPDGHMHDLIGQFGQLNDRGNRTFRHTIHGGQESGLGLSVANQDSRILLCQSGKASPWAYWEHDTLINAFVAKFRRLIAAYGKRRNEGQQRLVSYQSAHLYWEPQATRFIELVADGIVAIDFDARTNERRGLRNHGTKFRVKPGDLKRLYNHHQAF